MAKNVYECMFIFDPNSYARDPAGVSGKVPQMVASCGGEVLVSRLWNEQKLAYPIKGHRKGTYWLSYFRMDGSRLTDFNRACHLNEDILRNLTLKVDPRLVEALVAHAKGERVLPKVEEAPVSTPVAVADEEEGVEPDDGWANEGEGRGDEDDV